MEAYVPKDVAFRLGLAAFGAGLLYALSLAVYRLFFSPIAGFPGPKIAAVTSYYELYYDVIHQGKYLFEIEKMHDKYGISAPNCQGRNLQYRPNREDQSV